ncbi:hypothetical protein BC940DRAFT_68418 [Gongronella butleri]|nr:hypothetical protein BC940DRAFT_68418 [Gongronella butleri]
MGDNGQFSLFFAFSPDVCHDTTLPNGAIAFACDRRVKNEEVVMAQARVLCRDQLLRSKKKKKAPISIHSGRSADKQWPPKCGHGETGPSGLSVASLAPMTSMYSKKQGTRHCKEQGTNEPKVWWQEQWVFSFSHRPFPLLNHFQELLMILGLLLLEIAAGLPIQALNVPAKRNLSPQAACMDADTTRSPICSTPP